MATLGDSPLARIAVVLQGNPTDPASWSGVPARLLGGLEAAGCETVPVSAFFPRAGEVARLLRMSWTDQATSRPYSAACSAAASRALRRAGRLDGAVQIGSGYALSTEIPVVTFEDMTLAQALRMPDSDYEGLSSASTSRWLARQHRNYRSSRACCVAGHWTAASVRDDYGIPAAKVRVVGFGRNAEPERIDRDWSVPRFLFVGREWKRKRGQAVVESFAAVRQRHPGATLDLVGGHPPIEADGVTGHGTLALGSPEGQRKYRELISRATCFVMPSVYEPFGIAYLDAGAAGLPSIGTTVGGAPDAVGDGGLAVDPHDQPALTMAMLEMAKPNTAEELGRRAFARSHLFTWQAVAERLVRALRPSGVAVDQLADFLPTVRPVEVGSQ